MTVTMRRVTLMTFVALAVSCISGTSSTTHAAPPSFEDGTPAPTLKLPHLETGEPTGLDAYRGKRVVLHIFASW